MGCVYLALGDRFWCSGRLNWSLRQITVDHFFVGVAEFLRPKVGHQLRRNFSLRILSDTPTLSPAEPSTGGGSHFNKSLKHSPRLHHTLTP